MLHLIKYEYRKNMVLYIVLFALIFAIEALCGLAIAVEDEFVTFFTIYVAMQGIPIVMLFFFVTNIITYSRELNSRAGYLAFMTPCSAFEIAGSKFLTMIINATLAIGLFIGFGAIDFAALMAKFGGEFDFEEFIRELALVLSIFGINIDFSSVIAMIIVLFLMVFTIMSLLFFAITLSRTLLENRGGRVPLAILFFVVLIVANIFAIVYMPSFSFGDTAMLSFLGRWPLIFLMLLEFAGSYIGSSFLLEKKLSV